MEWWGGVLRLGCRDQTGPWEPPPLPTWVSRSPDGQPDADGQQEWLWKRFVCSFILKKKDHLFTVYIFWRPQPISWVTFPGWAVCYLHLYPTTTPELTRDLSESFTAPRKVVTSWHPGLFVCLIDWSLAKYFPDYILGMVQIIKEPTVWCNYE